MSGSVNGRVDDEAAIPARAAESGKLSTPAAESGEHGRPIGPKLSVRDLTKTFPGRRGRDDVVAIDGIDLHVDDGELVCIVGASGCGKSTLLNIVGGLEDKTSGDVEVDGEPVIGPGPDRGMVFQGYSLFPWRTVTDNVAFGLECAGTPKADRRERVDELLGIMGLREFADRHPNELSGGMRQRVAIARALAPEPDVLLLDEPFGALDAQTKKAMQDFLLTVWRRTTTTILMVTHDVEESIYLSQRIYVLESRPGRVDTVVDVPFGNNRGPTVKRDARFLDLRDEIEDLLVTTPT
ncbi:MAG: ABC transporter ATP-binding protein [Actinomycetota bacterium]|nr:ABC transporter ATP-binding protein [Actinomycetota bacterium]